MFHTCVVRTCPVGEYVCDPKIEIPLQYVTTTSQVRRKRGRPARSGEQGKEGDAEEEARKKVHGEGYEVPSVTMHMETVDSDQDFEEPPQQSQEYVDFLSMLIAKYAMMLMRVSSRKKERNRWTEYPIETRGARTCKEDTREGVARGRCHHNRLFVAR